MCGCCILAGATCPAGSLGYFNLSPMFCTQKEKRMCFDLLVNISDLVLHLKNYDVIITVNCEASMPFEVVTSFSSCLINWLLVPINKTFPFSSPIYKTTYGNVDNIMGKANPNAEPVVILSLELGLLCWVV